VASFRRSHGAAAAAVQGHSREVVTVSDPLVPPASAVIVAGVTVSAQRSPVGPSSVDVDPDPQRAEAMAAAIRIAARATERFVTGVAKHSAARSIRASRVTGVSGVVDQKHYGDLDDSASVLSR